MRRRIKDGQKKQGKLDKNKKVWKNTLLERWESKKRRV